MKTGDPKVWDVAVVQANRICRQATRCLEISQGYSRPATKTQTRYAPFGDRNRHLAQANIPRHSTRISAEGTLMLSGRAWHVGGNN